jgi:hypothetical protein
LGVSLSGSLLSVLRGDASYRVVKAQTNKARAKGKGAVKRTQSAGLTGMVILDALRTWLIPTVAGVAGFVVFILYSVEVVDSEVAVTVIGTLALAVVLFYGLRGFADPPVDGRLVAILLAYAGLWSVTAFYPFYRTLHPGTPLFAGELHRGGAAVTVPLHGVPGRYHLIVEGSFLPAEGRIDREAKFNIALGHNGTPDRVLEGTFSQHWLSQRIGAGRRSSYIPVMQQRTQVLEPIDDLDGHDLTLSLTELSADMRDRVSLRLYGETVPKTLWIVLGLLTVAGAVLLDGWRTRGSSEALLAGLTIATLISVVVFRNFTVAVPGFPELILATLAGVMVGVIGASLLWRLTRPLRKYLPARP